ncbi:hypothetical protein [Hyphomonas chukchiensis]|uniref:hypothetical protein n=1 Tax=Hyphomonas chukchiensis TaxID=1280947 RepID=UPI0030F845EE
MLAKSFGIFSLASLFWASAATAETVNLECPWATGGNSFVFDLDLENKTALVSSGTHPESAQLAKIIVHENQVIIQNPGGMANGFAINRQSLASIWNHPLGGAGHCVKKEIAQPKENVF